MTLYISNRGEVACGKNTRHGGMYLTSAIKQDPDVVMIDTPLDHWCKLPSGAEEMFGLICEACEQERA